MPFTSQPDLPTNPDVRVFFSGLLIIDPNPQPATLEPNTCEVFVHRSAPDHVLTVEVRRKRQGKADVVLMRHVGQLAFLTPESGVDPRLGMSIRVNTNIKGVRRYDPPGPVEPPVEGEGLGLAIDIEQLPSQPRKSVGSVNPLGGRPSILLNDAVFYTAAKTDGGLEVGLKKGDAVVVPKLDPFASVIGANIYLDTGSSVLVSWVQQGLLQSLELEKPKEEGLSYEIYIVNEPLFESESSGLPRHDELREYFKILPEAEELFELKLPESLPHIPAAKRGSLTTPCMAVLKGGGGGEG
jgi:hypothetical protein